MFMMRFDMRAPEFGASTSELYAAALEMASFAESRGALAAAVCEHHTMADGYLPSPLVLATAMAARTDTLPIMTAALVLPLYDPIRLAEDMVVLDIISGGRVSYIMAVGYRPEESEHHGADFGRRGRLVENQLDLLLRAKSGEPFEHEGRHIHVTPAPVTPGGPDGDLGRWQPRSGQDGPPASASTSSPRVAEPGLEEIYAERGPRPWPRARLLHDPVHRHGHHGLRGRRPRRGLGRVGPPPPARRSQLRRPQPGQHPHRQHLHRRLGRGAPGREPHPSHRAVEEAAR